MRNKLRWLLALGAIVALALTVSACGSGDSTSSDTSSSSNEFAPITQAPSDAQQGGELTVISASDVDYIDPGASYYQYSYMVTSATQSNLEGYAPDDVEQPTPLLATDHPTVSADGKTITYTLRDDVKYSPPRGPSRDRCRRQVRDRALTAARRPKRLRADVPGRR